MYCAKVAPGEERNWPILRRSKPWIIKLPATRSREGAHCGGRARDHHPPSPRLELRQPLRANLVEYAVAAVLAAHLATRVEVVEEAAAWGVPAVALRAGGYLDTVVENQTGVFFDAPDSTAISKAVESAYASKWNRDAVREHADKFSEANFIKQIRDIAFGLLKNR